MKYEILLWDVDDTLLDFKKSESYALKKTLQIENIDATDEMVSHYSRINESCWKKLERGEMTKEEVLHQRFRLFFEAEDINDVILERVYENYPYYLGSVYFYKDHSLELLTELKQKGYRQYLVTNGVKRVQLSKLKKAGIDTIVDGIFISEEIGYHKPEREFFEKCFEMIGEHDLGKYLLIGDSLSSDIKGANNAKIDCCLLCNGQEEKTTDLRVNYKILNLNLIKGILGI